MKSVETAEQQSRSHRLGKVADFPSELPDLTVMPKARDGWLSVGDLSFRSLAQVTYPVKRSCGLHQGQSRRNKNLGRAELGLYVR